MAAINSDGNGWGLKYSRCPRNKKGRTVSSNNWLWLEQLEAANPSYRARELPVPSQLVAKDAVEYYMTRNGGKQYHGRSRSSGRANDRTS
jgi:hypothetical protein